MSGSPERPVVRVELAGRVGHVVLDRPDQLNAITVRLAAELREALLMLGADREVAVVAVRGAGGTFCSGGDFAEVERLRAGGPAALRGLFETFAAACRAIREIPVPVVAVVEGAAAAGGFELMQAADLVLVRADARISDSHIRYGQIPGGGSTQRLPRLIGRQQALALLLGGERISGRVAHDLGLAQWCWEADVFDSEADRFLRTLAARDRDAVRAVKRLVTEGAELDLDSALRLELDAVVDHIAGPAGGAGVAAFEARSAR